MAPKRSHSQNREVLCGICYRKEKELRKISPSNLVLLQTHVDARYSLTEPRFQTVLCSSCIRTLTELKKNPESPERGRVLKFPKYDNMNPPTIT